MQSSPPDRAIASLKATCSETSRPAPSRPPTAGRCRGRRKPIVRRSAAGRRESRSAGRRLRGTWRLRSSLRRPAPKSDASSPAGTSDRDAAPRRRSNAAPRWPGRQLAPDCRRASGRPLQSRRRGREMPGRRRGRPSPDDRSPPSRSGGFRRGRRSVHRQCARCARAGGPPGRRDRSPCRDAPHGGHRSANAAESRANRRRCR